MNINFSIFNIKYSILNAPLHFALRQKYRRGMGEATITLLLFLCALPIKAQQVLEVFNVQGSTAQARLTIDGNEIFTTNVYIGKDGIGKTTEMDALTPTDTLHEVKAFGIKPNPGTTIPYTDITPTTFACDEDCQYYNMIIDTAAVHHPNCKGEDMYHITPEYNYGIATDYNHQRIYPNGSNIFIHCKGNKPYTGGCIAFDEDKMIEILRRCNNSLIVVVSPTRTE